MTCEFQPDMRVKIRGLISEKGREFNGKFGMIEEKRSNGRWAVNIHLDEDYKIVAIKEENLRFLTAEEAEIDEKQREKVREILWKLGALPLPDEDGWQNFLQRPVGLGISIAEADLIGFSSLRFHMLQSFIPCSGVSTKEGLLDILHAQTENFPIPKWFKPKGRKYGPRHLGYQSCENEGCLKTEDVETKFKWCSGCKAVYYCGRKCQKKDYKKRHKKTCVEQKDERNMTMKAGYALEMISLMFEFGIEKEACEEWFKYPTKEKARQLGLDIENLKQFLQRFPSHSKKDEKKAKFFLQQLE